MSQRTRDGAVSLWQGSCCVAALEQVRRGVVGDARRCRRYPQEVEAAVYFCVLEALQNVAVPGAAEDGPFGPRRVT